jgi:hypothetical protein
MKPLPGSSEPALRTGWPAGIDRRTLLRGAAAAGAATLAVPLLGQASANAATRKVIYGANHDFLGRWTSYHSGHHGPHPPPPGTPLASPDRKNCERRYFDAIVPYDDATGHKTGKHSPLVKDWAAMKTLTDYAIVSLRINPVYLLHHAHDPIPDNGSGFTTLDGQIRHLLSSMPAHSVLTNWQEAGPGNTLNFPTYVSAANTRGLHNHMQRLVNKVRADGGHVDYGQIVIDDPNGPGFSSWLGSDLDCYMIDIYDFSKRTISVAGCPGKVGGRGPGRYRNASGTLNQSKISTRMDNYLAAFKGVTKATAPQIHISETNSPLDGHRKNWFRFLTEWMSSHGGFRICSHWDRCGPDSGDWPTDKSLLDYFVFLQHKFGA